MNKTFQQELQDLINKYNEEKISNTPDFILAAYVRECLDNFNLTVRRRDEWKNIKS